MDTEIYELRALIGDIIETIDNPSIVEWIKDRLNDIENTI